MIPFTAIDTVWHVGTLELSDRTDRRSLEGNLLSVSQHPDTWSDIARCAGIIWKLERDGALWLDALALSDEQEAEIRAWALSEGLAREATLYRVWHFDGEADDWGFFEFENEERAFKELDDPEEWDGVEIPSESGEQLDRIAGVVLTDAGMEAVGRWADVTHAGDALLMIWADRVLKPGNADLMGVWWYEDDNPLSLSCPRGGVFVDRLSEFEIIDERGNEPPESFRRMHAGTEEDMPCP